MKKTFSFFSFACIIGLFGLNPYTNAEVSSCLQDNSCTVGNETPQALSDFEHGCYGLNSIFRPILIPENQPTLGTLFLAKLQPESEVFNIILCAENTPPEHLETISFDNYFQENISEDFKVPLEFDFFLGNSYKDSFEISSLGKDEQRKYLFLATGGGVQFIRKEIRYSLAGMKAQEKDFDDKEEGKIVKMLPNLELAIEAGDREQSPVWESPFTSYNDECVLSDIESKCLLEAEISVPKISPSTFSENTSDPLELVLEESSTPTEAEIFPEGKQLSYRFQARDTDGNSDITYDFHMTHKNGKQCVSAQEFIIDDQSETVCNFTEYFVYTQSDYTLRQKEGVILKQDESPYVLKVTAREIKDEDLVASHHWNTPEVIGVYAENTDSEIGKTATIERLSISVVEPLKVAEQGSAGVTPPVVTSRPQVDDEGGQDAIVVQRLRDGQEFKTIGEESDIDVSVLNSIENDSDFLFCPQKKYYRYPENRGKGISESLFPDVSVQDRSYLSLLDLAEQGIIHGDQTTKTARLQDSLSRAEFVKIMTIAREDTLFLGECLQFSHFIDIPKDEWFTPFVQNLEQKAIIRGYTDNRYRPEKAINLVEVYKIVALSFDFITLEQAYTLTHNQQIEWYEPYKNALETAGVIPLWFQEYSPEHRISRGDMVALLATVLRYKDWTNALDLEIV